jgi:hypothetical protein
VEFLRGLNYEVHLNDEAAKPLDLNDEKCLSVSKL